jgi:hypothetical protein
MELDFFVHPGWQPRIRPAGGKRDWMENTAERFAYRCLPLAIANAHGWEVGSPCGFEARWRGGAGVDSVEIRPDPGADPHRRPVSLFGQGTITFHIEAIVRTPPGWNLWVGGSPNAAKDGIAPLGAVIETDWSPYTFTMNWRFTRADHWVRFEEDEPFCFFFPVQRGVVDAVEPAFRPLDEAPALRDAFASWSASRTAFQAWVEETSPAAPTDRWQKLYYRGVNPDGSRGAADHQSKLRVAIPAGQDAICPATGAPARAASPAPVVLTPVADITAQTPERALRQREWLLSVAERQRELSEATAGIARVRGPSSDEFLDYFYAPGRPVLIEGELQEWPALGWTPARLADIAAGMKVEVQDELGTLDKFLTPDPGLVEIAATGMLTPLRYDPLNTLHVQIAGRQRWYLLPPSETGKLYNHRGTGSEVRDLADPRCLRRYPLAAEARAFELVLGPGDVLFIPVGWWHQARCEEFSVMATHTNFIWSNDADRTFPGA